MYRKKSNRLNDILEQEHKNELFDLSYRGVPYWHFMRYALIVNSLYSNAKNIHPCINPRRNNIKLALMCLVNMIFQFKYIFKKPKADLFIATPYYAKNINGKEENIHTFFYEKEYNCQISLLLGKRNADTKIPKDKINNTLLEIKWIGARLVNNILYMFAKKQEEDFIKLAKNLSDMFGGNHNAKELEKKVYFLVKKHLFIKRYYKKLLEGNYKAVMIVCSYSFHMYALIAAARECNIKIIEIQHGVMGENNAPYNYYTDYENLFLPDYVFTFGDFWSTTCKMPKSTQLISVGSPIFDMFRKITETIVVDDKKVIFYSSGHVGEKLSKLAKELALEAYPLGYKIIYKLHPSECREWQQLYPWLKGDKKIEVDATNTNIYEVIAKSRYNVFVDTFVLFEAIGLNKTPYIYNIEQAENIDYLKENEVAKYFDSSQELLDLVTNDITNKDIQSEEFFINNSDSNITKYLAQLVKVNKKI